MILPRPWNQSLKTTIEIEMISPKQLIGECLDLACLVLFDLVQIYCNNNHIQHSLNHSRFFSYCSLYIGSLQQNDIQLDFIKQDPKSNKPFVKSWLYQLKYLRNCWAHSPPQSLHYRLANRGFDTLSLLYMAFKGNPQTELFTKIQLYRKRLLIATATKYHLGQ